MPLPLILGIGAAIAGAAGIGSGVNGAKKMKEASDTMKSAERRHNRNIAEFDRKSESVNKTMDELGTLELNILNSFKDFSDTIEKIQNRPKFKEYKKNDISLPEYDKEELEKVYVGAGVLLGGLGGAAAGTAGGFAAAGAATSAAMALGTASTGTAIASLSGAAATNATLAVLGGGAIAAGGGGIALRTTVLGAATLGVGLLVGGNIFNVSGGKLSDKADEAYSQMREAERAIDKICSYLTELEDAAGEYCTTLRSVEERYKSCFSVVFSAVDTMQKTDWNEFSKEEKKATENTVLLVGLLYKMCQVELVKKAVDEEEMNAVNKADIERSVRDAREVLVMI